jgi:galactose-1-phosphate uridylyltransferase
MDPLSSHAFPAWYFHENLLDFPYQEFFQRFSLIAMMPEERKSMKNPIRFETHFQESSFTNPMKNHALDTHTLEIRRDPLTGSQSTFNEGLKDKAVFFFGVTDPRLVEQLAEAGRATCFLCEDRWKLATPRYPEELLAEGRVEVGEAVLFPNLFPVSQVHAVIRVGNAHYLPLDAFEPARILEGFQACRTFTEALARVLPDAEHLTINGNYLHPAGASIAHPHFQLVGGDLPCTWMERILSLGRDWHRQGGQCYWQTLAETERSSGERYVGETGPVCWITSFSPQGTNEVLGLLPEKRNFLEMDGDDLRGLADGLSRVLKGYGSLGVSTFNFSVFSGPLTEPDDSFRCFLRIVSRQNVYENYRTDDYFLQKLLRNELILTLPEELASMLRDFF